MFKEFDLPARFKISEDSLLKFVNKCSEKYLPNPYHNFKHAFVVTHFVYLIFSNTSAMRFVTYLDIFGALGMTHPSHILSSLISFLPHPIFISPTFLDHTCLFPLYAHLFHLVAALGHDIDHPGQNNDFMIKTRDSRALIFSDDSVLERHHATTTFGVIFSAPDDKNIFAGLDKADRLEIRKTIIRAILGTDMKHQREHVKALDVHAHRNPVFDKSSLMDRQMIVEILVHAGDLGAQTYTQPIALKWGALVLEEFAAQADLEKRMNVPVTTFMIFSNESR
jgi:hypothetical protein